MVWTCHRQANIGADAGKFLHASCWLIKENGQAEEDVDGSNKDRSEEVQPIQRFSQYILEWQNGIYVADAADLNMVGTRLL